MTKNGDDLKLVNGNTEYTGTPETIIDNAATGKASDSATETTTTPKLAANDTIQLGGDISYSGTLKFNSGISLTLNLTGSDGTKHNITSTGGNAILIGDTVEKPYNTYKGVKLGNNLTVIGNGKISGNKNGIYFTGPQYGNPDLESSKYSNLIIGTNGGNDEIYITGTNSRGVSGCGSAGYFNVEVNTTGIIEGKEAGIYNPQVGKLTINSGTIQGLQDDPDTDANEGSNGSGVEIRAGELEVNGGTIKSGSNVSGFTFNANGNGTTTKGAGIAVAQHETQKAITVNINNGTVEGYAALSVINPGSTTIGTLTAFGEPGTKVAKTLNSDNPDCMGEKDPNGGTDRVIGKIIVNANGGVFSSNNNEETDNSTSTGTTEDGNGVSVTSRTLTGKIAVLNCDSRVTVNLSGIEANGGILSTTEGRAEGDYGYNIGTGNTLSGFDASEDSAGSLISYSTVEDQNPDSNFSLSILGKGNAFNRPDKDATEWIYLAGSGSSATTVASIGSATGDSNTLELTVTGQPSLGTAAEIDFTSDLFSKYNNATKFDGSAAPASFPLNIKGNDKITSISGGAGNDSLKPGSATSVTLTGGAGNDLFFFDGNKNTITDFGTGNDSVTLANSKFRPANADFLAENDKITIDFGGGDALMFTNLGTNEVSLPGGHVFATRYHAFNKQIALTSVQTEAFDASTDKFANYATIDAAEAGAAIQITGNSQDNRIIGSNQGGVLNGGDGNDRLIVTDRNSSAKYKFEYTAGKDSIEGFDDANDTLAVDATKITEAEGNGSKLTLTFADKDSGVILKSDVDIEKVSLNASGDYLTNSGYRATDTFKLFANAKGKIDLTDTPYKDTGIKTIDATDAKKQSVTLTADKNVTTVKLAENKKKDLFNFGGGTVSITGYEAGTDKLNIADVGAVSLFTVDSTGVSINAGGKGIISIQGALEDQEILIRDGGKNNSYQKFVFHDNGVLYNKAKKPTQADIYSNVSTSSTIKVDDSIKKIFLQTGVSGAKIESGNNKATLDASEADGVTLIGGAKNNKFIASTGADMFVYKGGKDVIKDFDAKDEISFNATDFNLNTAKISASGKSLKFKFTNKNVLTLKSDSKITSASINGGDYSFSKNAVGLNGVVSLTSQFSGSYNLEKSTANGNTVYGGDVRKNITFKGTNAAESLVGGQKKTNFKGGGGDDTFVGGDGKDIFFYAKTDSGNKTIENFGFGSNNDKIKIASGTIKTISKSDNDIIFSTNGGSLTLTKDAEDTKDVLIKANNTYYWFADSTTAGKTDGVSVGDLITADTRVSNAQATAAVESGYEILDLSYTTNLVKTNLATKAGEFEFTSSSGISKNDT